MPDYVQFHDPDRTWLIFQWLETYTDGMGAWRCLPEDAHLLHQDEATMEDVLQWKYLASIIEKQKDEREKAERDGRTTF